MKVLFPSLDLKVIYKLFEGSFAFFEGISKRQQDLQGCASKLDLNCYMKQPLLVQIFLSPKLK